MSIKSTEYVLELLRTKYPNGVSSTELHSQCGPAAKTRIGELRKEGWQISTIPGSECSTYVLQSLIKLEAKVQEGGFKITKDQRGSWEASAFSSFADAGIYTETEIEAAKQAILDLLQMMLPKRPQAPALGAYKPSAERWSATPIPSQIDHDFDWLSND